MKKIILTFCLIVLLVIMSNGICAQVVSNELGKPILSYGDIKNNDTLTLEHFLQQKGFIITQENGATSMVEHYRFLILPKAKTSLIEFTGSGLLMTNYRLDYLTNTLKSGDMILIDSIKILNPLFSEYANPITIYLK